MKLSLARPLAIIDLETTGTAVEIDRIVEIAIIKVYPDGRKTDYSKRVNPGISIPPEASKVHHIRDKDVKSQPTFKKIAQGVALILKNCDVVGFNIAGFDLPLLQSEFERAGVKFAIEDRAVIDAARIFHSKEPRNLDAAARFYLNTDHKDAHSALADARMCWRVLEAQLRRYSDLPRDPSGLHEFCNPASDRYLDSGHRFEWRHRRAAFAFGKYRGRFLKDVAEEDREYLEWMAGSDFPRDTKKIVAMALQRKFPKPNGKSASLQKRLVSNQERP
jgi:DNA polymerase III subunit epsilon